MHILVDVQNFLYAIPSYRKILMKNFELAIHQLIHEFSQYQDWAHDQVTLVFDGPGKKELMSAHGLEIIFSGESASADSVIERIIAQNKSKKDFLVITSDHAIKEGVSAWGARSVSPLQFVKMMDYEITDQKKQHEKFLRKKE